MSKQYGFSFDSGRCIQCWSCEVACKQWHAIKAGTIKLRRVEEVTSGVFPDVKRTFKSISCLHCAEPACLAACPQGAIYKRAEDGIVLVDAEKCTGCRACFEVCPVQAPQFDENSTMRKCDMCLDRVENGQTPICAATCPTGALAWGDLEEFRKK
jgi:anaerobic dimethyl sulfoxide reductase subunit B